jgi:hypothetical protein
LSSIGCLTPKQSIASVVERFFDAASPKRVEDSFDRMQYEEFWQEFRAILWRQRAAR